MSTMDRIARDIDIFNNTLGDKIKMIQDKENSRIEHRRTLEGELGDIRQLIGTLVRKLEDQEDSRNENQSDILNLLEALVEQKPPSIEEPLLRMSSLLSGVIIGIVLSAAALVLNKVLF